MRSSSADAYAHSTRIPARAHTHAHAHAHAHANTHANANVFTRAHPMQSHTHAHVTFPTAPAVDAATEPASSVDATAESTTTYASNGRHRCRRHS